MQIDDLIKMAATRLAYLGTIRYDAERLGDAARVADVDKELADTQATLTTLQAIS
jgi:hypothetical protein